MQRADSHIKNYHYGWESRQVRGRERKQLVKENLTFYFPPRNLGYCHDNFSKKNLKEKNTLLIHVVSWEWKKRDGEEAREIIVLMIYLDFEMER